ncbi:hypothetical protein GCM10020360_06550 [Nonlabens tegetincola]
MNMHTRYPAPANARPLGLGFVTAVTNSASPAAHWRELALTHGDGGFAHRATDEAALERAQRAIRLVYETSDEREAAELLNAMLAEHTGHAELAELSDGRWALRPALSPAADAAAALLHTAAFALGSWLAERGRCAWGSCAAEGCQNVFIDEGRRVPQRFCGGACATRTRVAAHRRTAAARKDGDLPPR